MADRPDSEGDDRGTAGESLNDDATTLDDPRVSASTLDEVTHTVSELGIATSGGRRPGEQFGRFTIIELLGEGGMGRVYSARDPKLDRKAAIKEVRLRSDEPEAMARGQARLLREAQALAKLAHPNVVTVYEVGTVRDGVFVAMEYIEGRTLRAWLEEEHTWSEIVACFVDAGRGLAAGHDAGLVHRDFKPDNVLVGDDGRARVIDFGLVRAIMAESVDEEARPLESSSGTPLTTPMTRTGALLGTPKFMSPEQHRGKRLDARSDQFAFCVALWEALYGEPPFAGDTYEELTDNVIDGRLRRPPRSGVPTRIENALTRGLSARADQRFASMHELLAALRRRPLVTPGRAVAIAVAGALVTAGVFAAVPDAEEEGARCRGFERKLAGVWDDARKASVAQAFKDTNRPYANDTFQRVVRIVDDYADRWVRVRTSACEATHVRGEQSGALLDRRMQCLDARMADLSALTELFAKRASPQLVDKAVDTALGLPDLAPCSDVATLTARVPPPADARVRKRVRDLRARNARLNVDFRAGKYQAGLPVAEELVNDADEVGYPPIQAGALITLALYQGKLGKHVDAEKALSRAVQLAAKGRDDLEAARAMISMVKSVGRQGRVDEALTLSGVAGASIERAAGSRDELRASLANNLGGLYYSKGRWGDARRELERAAELRVKAHGRDHPRVAASFHNLGILAKAQGKYEEAVGHHRRALAIRKSTLGPHHPQVASSLNSLGALAQATSDYAAARRYHERALAIWKGLSPKHPKVGHSLNNLGGLARAQGKYELALDYHKRTQKLWDQSFARDHRLKAAALHNIGVDYLALGKVDLAEAQLTAALAMRKKLLGPGHAQVAMTINELASVARRRGKVTESRALYQKAVAIWSKSLGPEHPNVCAALINLGEGYRAAKDCGRAIPKYRRALSIAEKKLGKTHPFIAHALVGLGACAVDTGKAASAVALLERAVAVNEKKGQPADLAVSRFQLARALWASGKGRKRARSLAKQAIVALSAGPKHKSSLAVVRAWMRGK